MEWFEGDVNANGIKIHYHRAGTRGKPTLLLLHGVTDSGKVWARVARDLADEFDLIMTDARGHGLSADLSRGISLELLAGDAAGVIERLGLDAPFVWGHSMGAITAAILAAEYPERVRAAVLEDPPFVSDEMKAAFLAAVAKPPAAAPDFRAMSPAERLAVARAMNPTWHEEELPPWAESKAQADPALAHHRAAIRDYSWREALARIKCPVLLLTGDPERGAIVTPEVAQESLALLKQGREVRITGTGHNIHRERYEETMDAVRAFLTG